MRGRKRNDGGERRRVHGIPLDPERTVTLYTTDTEAIIELSVTATGAKLYDIALPDPTPDTVRKALRVMVKVRERFANLPPEPPAPTPPPAELMVPPAAEFMAPPPIVDAEATNALPGGAVLDPQHASGFVLHYARGAWVILKPEYRQLIRTVPKDDLKEMRFRTFKGAGGEWSPWQTTEPEGARLLMRRLGARLGVTPEAWHALQTSGPPTASPGVPVLPPVVDAPQGPVALFGVPIVEEAHRTAYPAVVYRKGDGWALHAANVWTTISSLSEPEARQRKERWANGKDKIKKWGWRTQEVGGVWQDWATQNAEGVIHLMRAMGANLRITEGAWAWLGQRTDLSRFVERAQPSSEGGLIPVSRGEAFGTYIIDAPAHRIRPLVETLKELGWDDLFGEVTASSPAVLLNLVRSNIAPMFSFEPQALQQADELAQGIVASQQYTGASCGSLIVPAGRSYLPYQCDGIAYAMQRNNVLIADEPGLGKTIQLLGFVNNRPDVQSVIVVAPASLLTNWRREAEKWLTRPFSIYVCEDTTVGVPPDANFVIVNYEKLIDRTTTEIDYGPVPVVHEVYGVTNGYAIRNTVSGRRICNKTWRSLAVARQKALEFSKYGEPHGDGSVWGTTLTLGYWWWERGARMKAARRPVYRLVDASWNPAKDATYPTTEKEAREAFERTGVRVRESLGDVPYKSETKGVRPSLIHRDLMARRWDLLGVDEVHKLKYSGADPQKTSVAVLGYEDWKKKEGEPGALVEGLAQRATAHIYLSGTPMPNRTVEMWPYIHSLAPEMFPKFMPWAKRYAGAQRGKFGWEFEGNTHADELYQLLRGTMMVRRLKVDVLKQLPPKMRQVVMLPASILADAGLEVADDVLDQMEGALTGAIERSSGKAPSADRGAYEAAVAEIGLLEKQLSVHFSQMSRVRRDTALAKVPWVFEHVAELLRGGLECVVVMAHHHEVQNKLMELFNAPEKRGGGGGFGPGTAVLHTGGLAAQAKDAAVVAFQGVEEGGVKRPPDPRCKVFIGSILASGVGITLTRAHTLIFAELDWVPGNVTQAEDRVHRIGQTMPVLIQHLVIEGSIDARIVDALIAKQQASDAVMDTEVQAQTFDAAALSFAAREHAKSEAAQRRDDRKRRETESGEMRFTPEEWAVQVILTYAANGRTANPLNAYDLGIVEHVVQHHVQGLSGPKQRAAIAVALKIRGGMPDEVPILGSLGVPRPAQSEEEFYAEAAIQQLTAADADYAREQNAVGFSAADSGLGHELEARMSAGAMTDEDWHEAVRIARRYRKTQVAMPDRPRR